MTWAEETRRQSPWLRGADWEAEDRQLRRLARAPFHYDPQPLAGIAPGSVYTLLGPRRVGKSTATKIKIRELLRSGYPARRIVYLSCDGLQHRADLIALLHTIADEARPEAHGLLDGGDDRPLFLFLDEAQSIPDWPLAIKHHHDTGRLEEDCVVLTGSSARDLRSGGELLPGRRGRAPDRDRFLLPMPFRTFATIVAPDTPLPTGGFALDDLVQATDPTSAAYGELHRPRTEQAQADLETLLERYAEVGGFPSAVSDLVTQGDVDRATMTELWDVVRGDLNRHYQVRNPLIPLKVLERLALNIASPLSWTAIAEEANSNVRTVQSWVQRFADAFLFLVVYRSDSGVASEKSPKKLYPFDPLIARLAAAVHGRERFQPDLPAMVEALVAIALWRHQTRAMSTRLGTLPLLQYYQTSSGHEIDFLTGTPARAVEVKYQGKVTGNDAQRILKSSFVGVLLSRRTLVLDGPSTVPIIPAALFLTLLA